MKMARIGVLMDRQVAQNYWSYGFNVYGRYVGEILSHAGISFEWIYNPVNLTPAKWDVVLVALASEGKTTSDYIWNFAEQGGGVIAFAGLHSIATRLGYMKQSEVGSGYATLPDTDYEHPLRFLRAVPLTPLSEADGYEQGILTLNTPAGDQCGSVVTQMKIGTGYIDRFAVDIPYTIVGLQQGRGPVLEDGVPAPDASASVNDGVLKADDGSQVDWQWDRVRTHTGAPYFPHPYADLWREVLIGHVFRRVAERGLSLPFLACWPEGVSHVAMVSHDSDGNQDEHAESTLELLEACNIQSTWCMLEPGYSNTIYEKVNAAGHELAFHYNAVQADNGIWDRTEFDRQLSWFKQSTASSQVTSNKNHLTRVEGWGELFRWCEAKGIQSDQTRGPSKRGNVGLLFGTCHPYFPMAWSDEENRLYDVMEIGFLTQDLDIPNRSDSSVIVPFLEQVKRVNGVAHFLFHQIHIHNHETVRRAVRTVVEEARRRGFVFWTGRQINDWERLRRSAKIVGMSDRGVVQVHTSCKFDVETLVVWAPISGGEMGGNEKTTLIYGVPCRRANFVII